MSQQRETAVPVMHRPPGQHGLLASDADRDTVAGLLSAALAEGRLTAAEHEDRVRAAYIARTVDELGVLTADLPGPAGNAAGRRATVIHDEADRCVLCALLICCPPAGIAWLLATRRRSRAGGGAGAEDR